MKRIIAMMLALMMVFALCACGNDNSNDDTKANDDVKTLVVGIDPEYPPYAYMGDDGEYTGFDVETAKAVCDLLGWKMEIFALNWDQKLVQLDSKECDCIWAGMTILDSMKEAGYVISEPYYDNTQVLLVKSDSGYTSSKDLAGKTVAVQSDSSALSILTDESNAEMLALAKTFAKLKEYGDYNAAFLALESGAVDAIAMDIGVAKYQIKSRGDGYKQLDTILASEQYGIGFALGNTELRDAVSKTLAEIMADGTYAKLAEKFGVDGAINWN